MKLDSLVDRGGAQRPEQRHGALRSNEDAAPVHDEVRPEIGRQLRPVATLVYLEADCRRLRHRPEHLLLLRRNHLDDLTSKARLKERRHALLSIQQQ